MQDDRDVAGVEQLDDTEALEVDDDAEDEDRSTEVHQVGKILAVEGLPESVDLVLAGGEQEEQGDEGAVACVEGGRGEALPDDRLADVGGDEEGDAGAEMVAFSSSSSRRRTEATGWGSNGTRQTWSAAGLEKALEHGSTARSQVTH